MNEDCVFCRIIKGELPSFKFYEDEDCIAILDLFPNTSGQSLVISKKHYDSYFVKENDELFTKMFLAAKKVAKILDEKLGVKKTGIVLEGMGIDHAHIKLYPMYGLGPNWEPVVAEERVFFDKYPGFITTKMGFESPDDDLKAICEM